MKMMRNLYLMIMIGCLIITASISLGKDTNKKSQIEKKVNIE